MSSAPAAASSDSVSVSASALPSPSPPPPVQLIGLNFAFAQVTPGGYLLNKLQHEPRDAPSTDAENANDDDRVLRDINLTLTEGQRVLVVGGNGAGKSTLLGIIAGKHLTADQTALVFGRDSFRDTMLHLVRSYVSADLGQRSVAFATHAMAYSADIAIDEMMVKLQAENAARRDLLLQVLRIDPTWRLHRLSDGQRRRVQLFLALLRPVKLIVLDEVLGMLDLISRANLLQFLRHESEHRGATVLLATHIFDGTDAWASHVLYVRRGRIGFFGTMAECTAPTENEKEKAIVPTPRAMYTVVETWLRAELAENDQVEREAGSVASSLDPLANAQNRAGGYAAGRLGDVVDLSAAVKKEPSLQ